MSSSDSSKGPGSHALNQPPRRDHVGIWMVCLMAVGYLLALGLVLNNLLDLSFLLLGFFPAVILAFYFPRWIYLGGILLVFCLNAVILILRGNAFPAFLPALFGLGLALILAEMAHHLVLGQRMSQEMQAQEIVRLEGLLQLSSQDGLAFINPKGKIESWNRTMEEITGMPRGMVLGRMVWDAVYRLLPDDQRTHALYEEMKNELRDFSDKGQAPSSRLVREYQIVQLNGIRRTVEEILFPHFSSQGGGFGIILHDIHERKVMERNLQDANEMLLHSVEELQERNKEMSFLDEMGDQLQACTEMESAFQVISRFGESIFPGLSGCLFVFQENVNLFERKGTWGQPSGELESFGMEGCWAIKNGRVHVVSDSNAGPICLHLELPGKGCESIAYLCIPMTSQGEMIGILHVQAQSGMGLEKLEQTAVTAAARIGIVLVNLCLKERLTFQSLRDPLTGLFNRRYMEVTFERELRRAIRDQSPLGVVALAVDHYEHIKKVYGSETGDAVLKEVGAYLLANVRGEDIICRMEGEEFIVILPKASLEITNRRADQFRKGISGLEIARFGQSIGPISISAGTAGYPKHGSGSDAIFKAAETALQRAKSEGFDRVVSAEF